MNGQYKSAHFWLMLLGVSLGAIMEVGLVPEAGMAHKLMAAALMVLNAAGIQLAAKWQPQADKPANPEAN